MTELLFEVLQWLQCCCSMQLFIILFIINYYASISITYICMCINIYIPTVVFYDRVEQLVEVLQWLQWCCSMRLFITLSIIHSLCINLQRI